MLISQTKLSPGVVKFRVSFWEKAIETLDGIGNACAQARQLVVGDGGAECARPLASGLPLIQPSKLAARDRCSVQMHLLAEDCFAKYLTRSLGVRGDHRHHDLDKNKETWKKCKH